MWVNVLSYLEPSWWLATRVVSAELRALLSLEWVVRGLAQQSSGDAAIPLPTSCARRTRLSAGDPFLALIKGLMRVRRNKARAMDSACWKLWMKLHSRDHQALLRRAVVDRPELCRHRLSFYGERTLAMLAAWRGRLKCLKAALEYGADPDAVDVGGFSPLLFAAWANHLHVIKYLLRHHDVALDRKGEPPLSSSCGGTGPKTALEWATRKGFTAVANHLRAAAQKKKASPGGAEDDDDDFRSALSSFLPSSSDNNIVASERGSEKKTPFPFVARQKNHQTQLRRPRRSP